MNKTIQLNKRFRPEIEGLRVVAALLVAVYHIWLGRVSGGVDVFFVVSGFLITTSIVSKYNRTGEFKFIPYVTNLIKRLFPAVITVVFAVIILSAFFLPRTILDKTVSEVIASIFYYQNWQLALSNTDYLNQEQMKTPLEHFWAMSIQGQFYLIWFLVFTLIFYLAKKPLKINGLQLVNITLGILFILSLSYSIFLTSVNQPWAYFDVSTRIWEFSLGGLLAVNLSRIPLNAFVGNIIGWIGLIGLLLTGVIFDVSTLFPGYIALWPMLCAVAILMSGNIDTKFGVKRLLGSKPMVKIGGLSFGLYLWHWVILSFYQYHFDNRPSIVVGVGIIIFSLVLSWLMTKYIEEPLRYMKSTVKPILSIGIGIALNIILLYSLVFILNINTTDIDEKNYPGALAIKYELDYEDRGPIPSFIEAKEDLADSYEDKVHQHKSKGELKIGEYGELVDYQYTVVLAGSSHSAHWLGALQQFAKEEKIRIINITQLASRFSTSHEEGPQKEWNDNVINYLYENKNEINLVIATADIGLAEFPEPPEGMVEQLNYIGDEIGIPVMAIRDNQRFGFNIVEELEKYGYEKTKEKMNEVEPISDTAPWSLVDYKSPNVHPVDYSEYFKVNGEYEPVIGNVLIYYDGGHINNTYSQTMGPILKEDILNIIKQYE